MCPSGPSSDLPFVFGAYTAHVNQEVQAYEVVEAGASGDESGLRKTLIQLAGAAVRAVHHADGACVSLLDEQRPVLMATTTPLVTRISRLEVEVAEGPALASARTATKVVANSLDLDDRWPRLRTRLAPSEVRSALAVPLQSDGLLGVMTLYGRDRGAFDDTDARLADALAVPTAVAVRNAQSLARADQVASQLQAVLAGRGVVDRAIGIMMSRNGGSEERATALLRHMCEREHQDLTVMAQEIVDEALTQAESRYAQVRLRPSTQPTGRDA